MSLKPPTPSRRMGEARELLEQYLNEDELKDLPLLVLGNWGRVCFMFRKPILIEFFNHKRFIEKVI